jgi:hypothetical protein
MARIKLYYPVDEITNDLYTYGFELMTEDNVEYVGAFHRYITGEMYTGSKWDAKTSKKLIPYKRAGVQTVYRNLKPDIQLKYVSPIQITPTITSNDISNGSIQRYFIEKRNELIVFEINSNQYSKWGSNQIDNKIYNAVQLTWTLTGPKEDTKQGNVTIPGVTTKNTQQINAAAKTIPRIKTILNDPLQFYVDTDYIKPVDINGLK